jgi:hypothetical protein
MNIIEERTVRKVCVYNRLEQVENRSSYLLNKLVFTRNIRPVLTCEEILFIFNLVFINIDPWFQQRQILVHDQQKSRLHQNRQI